MTDLMLQTWARLQTWLRASAEALRDEEGQGLVEYSLILVLVSIVCIVILTTMGAQVNNVFSKVSSTLGSVAS